LLPSVPLVHTYMPFLFPLFVCLPVQCWASSESNRLAGNAPACPQTEQVGTPPARYCFPKDGCCSMPLWLGARGGGWSLRVHVRTAWHSRTGTTDTETDTETGTLGGCLLFPTPGPEQALTPG
jgi:hypothetical protein